MSAKKQLKKERNPVDAIMALENGCEDLEEAYTNMQVVINEGSGWRMQGSMGRAMMEAIESGRCCLGREGTRDYYGNYIPSRTEVKEGTTGSLAYVANFHGEGWARMIEEVL